MIQWFLEIGRQIGSTRKIESLALQVAETSVAGVHLRVLGCLATMTTSEARGFIRARAGQEIRRQTRILLARQQQPGNDWEARIVRLATEKVIPLMLHPQRARPSLRPSQNVAA